MLHREGTLTLPPTAQASVRAGKGGARQSWCPSLTGRGDGSPQGNGKGAQTQRSNLDVMSHFDPDAVLSNKQNKCGASLLTGGGSWLGVTCSARGWTDPELNPSPSCPTSAGPCWAPPSPSTY